MIKFAVPEECLSEDGMMDEIENEILEMIEYKLDLHWRHGFSVSQVCNSISEDVENIFKKYK